jgi:septum formation protein
MKRMGPHEIDAYVASGEAMGKAGAYALQETADRYVESIEGSYTNVVGLPMELLERMLKAAGHDPQDFRE